MRLIDADVLIDFIDVGHFRSPSEICFSEFDVVNMLEDCATVDAVEVDALEAWLYEIAMNNMGNYLGDACEEIISRLEGLRVFARERKEVSK